MSFKKIRINWWRIGDYVTFLLPWVLAIGLMAGCGPVKYVPTDTTERIEYRDSLIYILDTLEVPVPYEVVREVIPDMDTSCLETDIAKSVAFLDKERKELHHTLEQKGTVKTVVDTVVKIQYVNTYIDREVPVEVEVIKYKRDNIYYLSIFFNILILFVFIFKIYRKFS